MKNTVHDVLNHFFLITRAENYFTKSRFKASNEITIQEKKQFSKPFRISRENS